MSIYYHTGRQLHTLYDYIQYQTTIITIHVEVSSIWVCRINNTGPTHLRILCLCREPKNTRPAISLTVDIYYKCLSHRRLLAIFFLQVYDMLLKCSWLDLCENNDLERAENVLLKVYSSHSSCPTHMARTLHCTTVPIPKDYDPIFSFVF